MGERLDKFLASQGLGTRKEVGEAHPLRGGAGQRRPPAGPPAPKSSPAPTR